MNLSGMQSELAARLRAYDETTTDDLTQINRWLNMGQQYVTSKYNWPFMLAEEIVQTITDYTTGTIATTAGSTTVTFSGTIANSKTNYFLQTSSSLDWYQITAHTAGTATATVTPAIINDATADTFSIRKLLYTTTNSFDSIVDMKKTVNGMRLESVSPLIADFFLPLYFSPGSPRNYIISSPDSSGNTQFSLYYSPDTTINLYVKGIKKLTDLSATTDTTIIPTRWQSSMIDFAEHLGFASLNDAVRSKMAYERCENTIEDMRRVFNPDLGRHRVMRPIDGNMYGSPSWTLPPNYGRMSPW